jgi:hypothetical protein
LSNPGHIRVYRIGISEYNGPAYTKI